MVKEINELSLLSINAAIKGGLKIMEIYESNDFEVSNKDDDSPLTKADTLANKAILDYLKVSEISFISEEILASDYASRKDWEYCWIIDPLDGTKEFIKRNGEFTVNIALIKNNKPVFGVIYVPVTGDLYFGNVTKKDMVMIKTTSFFNSYEEFINNRIEPIQSNSTNKIRVVGSKSHMNEDTILFINNIKDKYPNKDVEIVSKGSSLKFFMVASGEADIYPRFAPMMEWDTAAGQEICESAGYKVLDQTTGESMVYNREKLLNSYFLVH